MKLHLDLAALLDIWVLGSPYMGTYPGWQRISQKAEIIPRPCRWARSLRRGHMQLHPWQKLGPVQVLKCQNKQFKRVVTINWSPKKIQWPAINITSSTWKCMLKIKRTNPVWLLPRNYKFEKSLQEFKNWCDITPMQRLQSNLYAIRAASGQSVGQ